MSPRHGGLLGARSPQLELMDDPRIGGAELAEALRQLRVINRVLLGAWPTVAGVDALWRAGGCPASLRLLDVGAGSGDATGALLRWAARHGVALRVTLLDLHPDTCALAAAHWRHEPRVEVACGDVFDLRPGAVDIVTAALLAHHVPDRRLPALLEVMARAARLGVVINDLHRHAAAYVAILLATRCLSRNRMIRHDAPLSVRRGFRAADWKRLRRELPCLELSYRRRVFFRWQVIVNDPRRHAKERKGENILPSRVFAGLRGSFKPYD